MSTRQDHLKRFTPIWTKGTPRLTPYELGRAAYATVGSLKGLPYGPGWRQLDYIRGFSDAWLEENYKRHGVRFTDAPEAVAA